MSIKDDDFSAQTIPPGTYELENLNDEIKRIPSEKGFFTDASSPFTIKPIFTTLGSIIEISSTITGSQIAFTPYDSIRDLLCFKTL